MKWPSREEAFSLLTEFTENKNLIKHGLAVEAAMRSYADAFGEDRDKWGIAGLLHDFDYEKYPDPHEHPYKGAEILRQRGFAPDELIEAILGHGNHTGVARTSTMAKALYAVDELTGLIIAVALVRPSKKIAEVSIKSVLKKWNNKMFARGVSREDIEHGARDLDIPLEQHIENVLAAMQGISQDLGL